MTAGSWLPFRSRRFIQGRNRSRLFVKQTCAACTPAGCRDLRRCFRGRRSPWRLALAGGITFGTLQAVPSPFGSAKGGGERRVHSALMVNCDHARFPARHAHPQAAEAARGRGRAAVPHLLVPAAASTGRCAPVVALSAGLNTPAAPRLPSATHQGWNAAHKRRSATNQRRPAAHQRSFSANQRPSAVNQHSCAAEQRSLAAQQRSYAAHQRWSAALFSLNAPRNSRVLALQTRRTTVLPAQAIRDSAGVPTGRVRAARRGHFLRGVAPITALGGGRCRNEKTPAVGRGFWGGQGPGWISTRRRRGRGRRTRCRRRCRCRRRR
jgi:hypothetical protein